MNKAIIIGNLTRDPDLRTTSNGKNACSFTVAVNRPFTNAQGVREADYIPVVVWGDRAASCAQYLHKGSKAAVEGNIQTRNYENKDGQKVYVTEIIAQQVEFLTPRSEQGLAHSAPPINAPAQERPQQTRMDTQTGFAETETDDLPF